MTKDVLNALMTPAGLCDPTTFRLVWVNPPLARLLFEHGLEQTISVRTLAPEVPMVGKAVESLLIREEASLPANNDTDATTARCQIGPLVEVAGDNLLLFQLLQSSGSDSSRATLNIFSRHMNAKVAAWDQEREALLQQINELKN